MSTDNFQKRYRDAYAVANGFIATGTFLKAAALLLAIGIVAIPFLLSTGEPYSYFTGAAIVIGISVGITVFGFGLLSGAAGQLILATVDTAVNTSPVLTQDQKINVLQASNITTHERLELEKQETKSPGKFPAM